MTPRFGHPIKAPVRSFESVQVFEPTLGLDASQPSTDAPLGTTPDSDNYIFRDGALEMRPGLTARGTSAQPLGDNVVTGMHQLVSVVEGRYPIASGTTQAAVYGQAATPNGWSVLSYVSAFGLNDPPNLTAGSHYADFTQIYYPTADENLAIWGTGSYQSLYCTLSNTTIFSSLTGAPQAKYVTTLDNYVLAYNVRQGSSDFVQRVQWSDRGSCSSWTQGLFGFEDLMTMKGQGTRIVVQDNKAILFSEQEIWQGVQREWPFQWSFQPYDTSRGCPYSWTVCGTPMGTMFLGKDYQVYLLPSGGGPAQPIGQRLHRKIRNLIDQPSRAWAVYDNTYGQYQLYYPIQGGSGYPQRAVFLDVNEGSWAPQSFDRGGATRSLTRGAEITVASSATTYGGLAAAGLRYADLAMTYAQMGGASELRAMLVGSSNGTLYYLNSNATNDDGTAIPAYWNSTVLAGSDPSEQKTITEFRMDYQANSASSVTIGFSQTQGATMTGQTQVALAPVSGVSQVIAYPYVAARYPSFQITTEGARSRIFRFYVKFRRGGR